MTFFIAVTTIAFAGLVAFLVSWRRDAKAARRAEDERVITGIGLILAIPPADNLAAPPRAIHIARSPLLGRKAAIRSHAAPADRIFGPVTLELPRPRWTPVPTRPFLLVAPTAERRRELVNA